MFLVLAFLEIGFPSNHEWAVAWVDWGPLSHQLMTAICKERSANKPTGAYNMCTRQEVKHNTLLT